MSSTAAPGYYQQQPPPKKKHTVRNVILALTVLAILALAGCLALLVSGANSVDKAIQASESEVGGQNNPVTIEAGKAFSVRGFDYKAGWALKDDMGMTVEKLRVTNNREKPDAALVQVKVWQGTEVLATADCTTEQIAVGTTVTLGCISADKLPSKYDKITINDTF